MELRRTEDPVYQTEKRIDPSKGHLGYKDCFFEATISGWFNGYKIGDKITVENRYFDEEKIKTTLYERYELRKDALIKHLNEQR